jgi:hypothetical protein
MIRLSPSSLERYDRCPGAYWAEKDLPYVESEYNAEGKFMHALMAAQGDKKKELLKQATRSQIADHNFCQREARALHLDVFGLGYSESGVDGWLSEHRSQVRLGQDVLVSGQVDYYSWKGDTGLVIDWKFGRDEVEGASENLQLRAYALICADGKPMTIYVATIQPRVDSDRRVSMAKYEPADLEFAADHIQDIATAVRASETKPLRVPGRDQCKYCKALGTDRCPESREMATALVPLQYSGIMPSGAELGELLEKVVVAEKVIDFLKGYAKERLLAGDEIPGWQLKQNAPMRTLPFTEKVWDFAQRHMETEEFMALCKIGVTDLQNALAHKLGWASKDARGHFNAMAGDAIEMKGKAPSLERVP